MYDKNSPESSNRRNIPQHNKSYIWQTHSKHYPQWWKIESISPKVRNKTRVPTLTTTIQHSFWSFSHSNHRRKQNKRNSDWGRSKTLTVCRWQDCLHQFSSVQSLSHVRLFATSWITARQASLSITNSQSLLKLMPFESVMPSSHLIFCCPLLHLAPVPPSIRVFSNESTLPMRWSKYWSFSLSISPSNEHPGLISFRMHWLDLLTVQGTLKSLLQHHSSKAIFWLSAFFTVQHSHPYMTTGKNHSLDQMDLCWKSNLSAF